ncbi:MAG: peptidylprolyl isomerase [Halobacteriales archaeon]|nr:peptidylprolyl isomerase [Halobacteriales archaeon]
MPPRPSTAQRENGGQPVEQGDLVRVHYTGRLEDDSVFDSSEGREPLSFEAGAGDVIKGFDEGVMGMRPGQSKRVVIAPEDGYGPWRQELLTQVERAWAGDQVVLPGMMVQVQGPDSEGEDDLMEGVVTEVGDESITLDFNHPLAGKILTFDITVVEVEPGA